MSALPLPGPRRRLPKAVRDPAPTPDAHSLPWSSFSSPQQVSVPAATTAPTAARPSSASTGCLRPGSPGGPRRGRTEVLRAGLRPRVRVRRQARHRHAQPVQARPDHRTVRAPRRLHGRAQQVHGAERPGRPGPAPAWRSATRSGCSAQRKLLDKYRDPAYLALPRLLERDDNQQIYWNTDLHWTPLGASVFTRALAAKLDPRLGKLTDLPHRAAA